MDVQIYIEKIAKILKDDLFMTDECLEDIKKDLLKVPTIDTEFGQDLKPDNNLYLSWPNRWKLINYTIHLFTNGTYQCWLYFDLHPIFLDPFTNEMQPQIYTIVEKLNKLTIEYFDILKKYYENPINVEGRRYQINKSYLIQFFGDFQKYDRNTPEIHK